MYKKETITDELERIQSEEGFKILFACEAGSRVWGFSSPNSDFDVRFVYLRPVGDYLRLEERRDVYERVLYDEIDVVGWDLTKFLRLLRGSNPSTIEWLSSHDVYYEDSRFQKVRELLGDCFDPLSSAYHYFGMAKQHDMRYLKNEMLSAKKYLYIIRSILAINWCITRFEPVPMRFDDLKNAMMPKDLLPNVDRMLASKRSTSETHMTEHDDGLDAWIHEEMGHIPTDLKQFTHKPKIEWERIDKVFLEALDM